MPELLVDGPDDGRRFAFTHGAGAPMDSDWMEKVASGLAGAGIRVVRFEFPYMAERRTSGRKRPPNSQKTLLQSWREVVVELGDPASLVIGGKSMGGRMASMVAAELGVAGLCCLGYPFHPPGKPDQLRVAHLRELDVPALIVQGERDPFGGRDEVGGFGLDPRIRFAWMPDGDHSFKPRKRSGHTEAGNVRACVAAIAGFVTGL